MEEKEYMECPDCSNAIEVKPTKCDEFLTNDLSGYCQYCKQYYEFSFDELEKYKESLKED